ncbi:hypothetical protein J3E69DRAFT_380228 [Trichoderma sp. SZMC 28015]
MAPKAAAPATTPDSGAGSSAKPTGTWDNIALLNDLLVAFYQVGNQAGNFNTQTNEAVVAFMTAQGHVTSWSAIRPVIPTISATFYTISIFTTFTLHLPQQSSSHSLVQISLPLTNFLLPFNTIHHSPRTSSAAPKMASSRQLMKWTPQVHEDILVSVFYNLTLSTEDWAKVMNDLKEMGYTFSESALRYATFIYLCTL